MQGKQVAIELIPISCKQTLWRQLLPHCPSLAFSAGPSWPGRNTWKIGQSCLVAFTLWHLLLLFWFSEMGVGVVGKQQATSFPTPIWFFQKYQITAGLLSLAQISREAKQTIFQNYIHSTIFWFVCSFSVFFFQLDVFCVLIQHLEPVLFWCSKLPLEAAFKPLAFPGMLFYKLLFFSPSFSPPQRKVSG